MKKRWDYYLGLLGLLLALGIPILQKVYQPGLSPVESSALRIEKDIQERERLFLEHFFSSDRSTIEHIPRTYVAIVREKQTYRPIHHSIALPAPLLERFEQADGPFLWWLPDGVFIFKPYPGAILGLPVLMNSPTTNKYELTPLLKKGEQLVEKEKGHALRFGSHPLPVGLGLSDSLPLHYPFLPWVFLLSVIVGCFFIYHYFQHLTLKIPGVLVRTLLLLLTYGGLLILLKVLGYEQLFEHQPLLKKISLPCVGFWNPLEWVFGSTIVLCIILNYRQGDSLWEKKPVWLPVIIYSFISISLWLLAWGIKALFFDAPLIFNFKNTFSLYPQVIVNLLSAVVLILSHYFGVQHLIQYMHRQRIPLRIRAVGIFTGIMLGMAMATFLPISISPAFAFITTLVFLPLWDIYMDYRTNTLSWTLFLLIPYALFPGLLFTKYLQQSIIEQGVIQARHLSERRDLLTEQKLLQLGEADFISKVNEIPAPDNREAFFWQSTGIFLLRAPHLQKNYLFEIGDSISPPPASVQLLKRLPLQGQKKIEIGFLKGEQLAQTRYFIRAQDKAIWLTPSSRYQALDNYADPGSPTFNRYLLLTENRDTAMAMINKWYFDPALQKENEVVAHQVKAREVRIFFGAASGENIMMVKSLNDFMEQIAISSLFFILLLSSLFIIHIFSTFGIVKEGFTIFAIDYDSLSTRIQSGTIGTILISFILIGVVSISFLQNTALSNKDKSLRDQIESTLTLIRQRAAFQSKPDTAEMLPQIAGIQHNLVARYTPEGLLAETRTNFFADARILPARLSRYTLRSLSRPFVYLSLPIDSEGLQLVLFPLDETTYAFDNHFGGLLQSNDTMQTDETVIRFLRYLMAAYALLLSIAIIMAIFITNSITRPITSIGEKLSQLSLEENQPLEWHSQDEIGRLVAIYNQMIEQLAEQARQLKKSEREEAWREMAKQVAHEIKNPLTPMKLNVQYLMRARAQQDPGQLDGLLKRISNTLIEQIDSLSRIATEFSNFAKMPKAQLTTFSLNQLLSSIYNLYKDQQHERLSVDLQMPETEALVQADKEQLMRVMTNLIRNGIQAIPEDRQGCIQIKMVSNERTALVSVRDNGSGIPEKLRKKVFVPNFTTKSSGTGLGLAISKNIIDSVNGNIYFETEEGKGTVFYIELPSVG